MTDSIYADPLPEAPLEDCHFYHTLDLPGIGTVTGMWDLRGSFEHYTNGYDFSGKRVLDIGTGSGFLSFSAEAAGAREVVSFDMDTSYRQDFLPFRDSVQYRARDGFAERHNAKIRQWHNAYWLAHSRLGSRAKAYYGDVYDLPAALGQFDVAIVGSILEHLADPVKALASVARRTDGAMLIVTPMLDTDEPIARFMGHREHPAKNHAFWTYSRGTFYHVLGMLGFEMTEISQRSFHSVTGGNELKRRYVITAERPGNGVG